MLDNCLIIQEKSLLIVFKELRIECVKGDYVNLTTCIDHLCNVRGIGNFEKIGVALVQPIKFSELAVR